jgi:hypothetical protein
VSAGPLRAAAAPVIPRLALLFAAALAASCARTGFPEGGPLDTTPPALESTIPEDKAIDVGTDTPIKIVFAEPLGPGAVSQVLNLLVVNPDRPRMVTTVGGRSIEIHPQAPLEPRTTYSVLLRPGLQDRRSNLTKQPVEITFSTGGPLTLTLLKGTVSMGGKPAAGASVLATNRDRGFGYRAFADSSGAFQLTSVAVGTYDVTAWSEANGEAGFQFTLEAGDTATAAIEKIGAGADVALTLTVADTSAPRLARVEPIARDGLELSFSDTLQRSWSPDLAKVLVLRLAPDVAPRGMPLDSVPPAAVRGDTLPVAEARRDTLQPKTLTLRLAAELADSAAYGVRVSGAVNAAGLVSADEPPFVLFRTRGVPDSTLTVPRADTTAAGAQAGARPDTAVGAEAGPEPDTTAVGVEGGARLDSTAVDTIPPPTAPADSLPEAALPKAAAPRNTLPGDTLPAERPPGDSTITREP